MAQFAAFLLAYTLSQFFRSFLAVIAPELSTELAIDATGLGTLSMAWFLAFALAQFAVGASLDRFGPRRTMPGFMCLAVAGAVLFAVATSFDLSIVAMALIGTGSAAIYMGAVYTFARTAPPERFAQLCSWLLGIGSIGNLLSATPLAYAVETVGWRFAFAAIAVATAVAALLVLVVVRDPPRAAEASGSRTSFAGALLELASIRAIWPMFPIVLVSYAVMLAERGLWVGPFLSEVHGLGPIERGNAILAMAAAMSIGALLYGPADRIFGTQKWVVVAGTALTTLLFLGLGLMPELPRLSAVTALVLIGGVGMTYVVLLAHIRTYLPEHLLGRGITLVNFLFFFGAVLLQPLSGLLVDRLRALGHAAADIYALLHLSFAGLLFAGLVIYLASRETNRGQSATAPARR
ncbi:MAG: MFS transporter [Hyphomicrobiaceae bacterium]